MNSQMCACLHTLGLADVSNLHTNVLFVCKKIYSVNQAIYWLILVINHKYFGQKPNELCLIFEVNHRKLLVEFVRNFFNIGLLV